MVDTTTISAEQARDESRQRRDMGGGPGRDEDLRRLAMTNLLGLKTDFAFWNPGLADDQALDPAPRELDELTGPPTPEGEAG